MNHAYSEIEGSRLSIPVKPPQEIDPDEVFKAMGVSDAESLSHATQAIAMTANFLQSAFPHIAQYSPPKNPIAGIAEKILGGPKATSSLEWALRHAVDFNAGVDRYGSKFVISLNYGAIIRAASWCCEIAAIEIDGLVPSGQPTIRESWLGGALFSVVPQSIQGQERYMQLLKAVTLYLFCHEFAHAVGGHVGYINATPNMSDVQRKALEAEADHVGGSAAAASIIHNIHIARQLGWNASHTPDSSSQYLIRIFVLSALILATLFHELTDPQSKRYLRPALRSIAMIGGVAVYIEAVTRMPFPPEIRVQSQFLSSKATEVERQYGIALLNKSSIGGSATAMELQESDLNELSSTYDLRDYLKTQFQKHLPFGMQEYLEQARRNVSERV